MTHHEKQDTRLARDGRMLTTSFNVLNTTQTDEHGAVSTVQFEIITAHYPGRKHFSGSIMRCTRSIERGIESKLYRHMLTGEKAPVQNTATPAARFSKATLEALHAEQVAQLLNNPDDLAAVIAWAERERA